MADVMDIMEMERPQTPELTKESIIAGEGRRGGSGSNRKKKSVDGTFKRPEGMHRELYALLYSDSKDYPPVIPTDMMPSLGGPGGYKQLKAKLGLKKVRPWRWMPFLNPGRKDGFRLHHWRRIVDEGKEYPFAKFNKSVPIPSYSDLEYQQLLHSDGWSKQETDHLFDLCRRFDLRFAVITDRWDRETFTAPRSAEDLKERYYNVSNVLAKTRTPTGQEPKLKMFDATHERKRKEQLTKLYDRTPEQVEEEQKLLEELRKIEMRKKEREKKTQDLQKLITAADNNSQSRKNETPGGSSRQRQGGPGRKKVANPQRVQGTKSDAASTPGSVTNLLESAGIKFPEIKSSGATLRSSRMKLPASVGQKKSKAIEQLLLELNIDLRPMPTEEICQHFNELRSDMVLLYELKMALANCEFELQTLKHQYEALQPGKQLEIPPNLIPKTKVSETSEPHESSSGSDTKKTISEVIDVGSGPLTPNRKRRAALEQGNLLKKLKKI